ncbi:Transcriptional repressor TCF25 [Babesia microti strain RI]|uniref:Transcriptional repressor TCF25 n=1 Tax=Babesia microti (strain RI) TaxID=1133968 RepID=A0A1N6LW86_BABMR|nr:Transcriptional repressor TCF25 [Babesia microti strain RI]SIO73128.1 Transcriptional repressor TCF25 [Babesia microti strain RI]|eukprot:XP_021337240.1 Transcriptional repressor TCF25 [Babesia microti strain RI]
MSLRQAKKLLSQQRSLLDDQRDSLIPEFSRKKFSFVDYHISSDDSLSQPSSDNDKYSSSGSSESRRNVIVANAKDTNPKHITGELSSPSDPESEILDTLEIEDIPKKTAAKTAIFTLQRGDLNFKSEIDNRAGKPFNTCTRNRRGNFLSKMCWLIQEPVTAAHSKLAHSNMKMINYPDKSRTHSKAVLFKLEPSDDYLNVLSMFKRAVNSHDVNMIADLLKQSPLHIYGLLKFVDIYNLQNDKEEAFRTLKLALQMLQLSFHKDFSPFNLDQDDHPMVMMDSGLYNNRVLIVALLMLMIYCEKQTCYKTALALGKLLLAIDIRNDKSHILLHIDHYFITLRDVFQFLNFSHQFNKHRHKVLTGKSIDSLPLQFMLPNFALALALILHSGTQFKANLEDLHQFLCLDDIKQGIPYSFYKHSQLDQELDNISRYGKDASNLYLLRALILFPSFIITLVDTLKTKSIGDKKLVSRLKAAGELVTFPIDILEHIHLLEMHCMCTSAKNSEIWSTNAILTWLVDACEWLSTIYQEDSLIEEYQMLWALNYNEEIVQAICLGDMYSFSGISTAEFTHPHILPSELSD